MSGIGKKKFERVVSGICRAMGKLKTNSNAEFQYNGNLFAPELIKYSYNFVLKLNLWK